MTAVDLGKGIKAHLRPAIGEDERRINAIRSKIEPLLIDRGVDDEEYTNQYRFAVCMVVTSKVEGLNGFTLPSVNDDAQSLVETYLKWMKLPLSVFTKWYQAPYTVEEASNADDLLPPEMVPEAVRKSPLPLTAEKRSA